MGTDYFANAVYGVLLDDGDEQDEENDKVFLDRIRKAIEAVHESQDEADGNLEDRVTVWLRANDSALFAELRKRYQAPAMTRLFWTGSEEERPGRCDTDADRWIFGIGIMAFPHVPVLSDAFEKNSDWHLWVEAG